MLQAYSKLLCVDDEPEILVALKRLFRGAGLHIDTANGGKEALKKIKGKTYDVIISDMRMPEMDGATFLQHAHELQPTAKRILLTGFSDQDSTIRAINKGKIFSYINKPWSNNDLRETVMHAIAEKFAAKELKLVAQESLQDKNTLESEKTHLLSQMGFVSSELELANIEVDSSRKELTQSHHNTIKTLASLVSGRVSLTRNFNEQIIFQSVLLAKKMSLKESTIREIRYAAYLYQVGKITLPESIINTPYYQLDEQDRETYEQYPDAGADILEPLGFLPMTADIIRNHRRDVSSMRINPSTHAEESAPIGACILRIIIDYNSLINGLYSKSRYSKKSALSYLKSYAGKKYASAFVSQFESLLPEIEKLQANLQEQQLTCKTLSEGMVVSRDIINMSGVLLVAKGTCLTAAIINKMQEFQKQDNAPLAIFILKQSISSANP